MIFLIGSPTHTGLDSTKTTGRCWPVFTQPIALIHSAVRPDDIISPSEFLTEARDHRWFMLGLRSVYPIDEQAGLIEARLRTTDENDTFWTGDRVWLLTFSEKQIYRQRIFSHRSDALDLYRIHGLNLAIIREGAIDVQRPLIKTE